MTLTLGTGPLANKPGGVFNFSLEDAPKHRIFFEDYPRRIRAVVGGHTVGDTARGKLLHETNILPVFYFHEDDLDQSVLEPTTHSTHCPFKGDAAYWSIRAGDRVVENAVWSYPQPLPDAPSLVGYRALYWDRMDTWLEEDEELLGHLRDPYHRVDVRESTRPVRVRGGGGVVAETTRPRLLFETGLPTRYYVPREDIAVDVLEPSEKRTVCPYKGRAAYESVRAGDAVLADVAWHYPEPLPGAAAVAGHVCFLGEGIETEVGEAT